MAGPSARPSQTRRRVNARLLRPRATSQNRPDGVTLARQTPACGASTLITRPQFSTVSWIRSPCGAPCTDVPSGASSARLPPVLSNVADMVSRLIDASTGMSNPRAAPAAVPLAQTINAESLRDDSTMMWPDSPTSDGLMKNGCPPVSVAILR